MKRGKFIVFEGIDGCGKSTQIWKLAKYLSELSKYNHVLVTRNPYKSREIREILALKEPAETQAEKLAELFIKDREEHIKELINPHLEKGHYVICDRYIFSTIAYQSAQGLPTNKLVEMQKNFPLPNIIFILDLSIETASERMKKDGRDEHKFEASLDFQKKVRQNYLELKNYFPKENIIIIDGSKSIEEIEKQIIENFHKLNI